MILITDKHNCCGCSACVQACPKQCISFDEDKQGFRYPLVDKDHCINCSLCEDVCPVLNQDESRIPLNVYAAINPDENIRSKSSSGGIFTLLAELVINEGGVVFGARFDENWEVKHDYTETKEGLSVFRGSKYVQSYIGESYRQTRDFLKSNRKVLFSGTSCQVAGLRKYLRKDYENLITIDVVCHGVPSPLVWRNYISQYKSQKIGYISTKYKESGWRDYSLCIKNTQGEVLCNESKFKNPYLVAFIRNLSLRQSCFNCPAKEGKSGSDITLADYWGIEHILPVLDDNKGVSFTCANTDKGLSLLSSLNIQLEETSYESTVPFNSCIVRSTIEPEERQLFWYLYYRDAYNTLRKVKGFKNSIIKRIYNRLFK